jgi:hypothetical protein
LHFNIKFNSGNLFEGRKFNIRMTSVPADQLLPGEQIALKDEARRIKAAIYAEYGDEINARMKQVMGTVASDGESQGCDGGAQLTYTQLRARRIEELISSQTPLRQQVRSCQNDAMQKLIEAAREDANRGVDVGSRLELLMKLKEDLEKSSPA